MDCPRCGQPMEEGWLTLFNPILWITFVVWQSVKPGYVRLFRSAGSVKVIVPRVGGRGNPRGRSAAAARRWCSAMLTIRWIDGVARAAPGVCS